MSEGLSRIYQNSFEERQTLGCTVYPTTPAEGYALTKENFPGLIEAFISDGISGTNLTGVLGTVVISSLTGWTQPVAGAFRASPGTAFSTSGTWESIADKEALLLVIGNFVSGAAVITRLGIGSSGSLISSGNGTSSSTVSRVSGSHYRTGAATALSGPTIASATRLDRSTANGEGYGYHCNGTTNEGPSLFSLVTSGDINETWNAFFTGGDGVSLTVNASSYYTGIFLLALNTIPASLSLFDVLRWMSAHPKQLFPGFYHLS